MDMRTSELQVRALKFLFKDYLIISLVESIQKQGKGATKWF